MHVCFSLSLDRCGLARRFISDYTRWLVLVYLCSANMFVFFPLSFCHISSWPGERPGWDQSGWNSRPWHRARQEEPRQRKRWVIELLKRVSASHLTRPQKHTLWHSCIHTQHNMSQLYLWFGTMLTTTSERVGPCVCLTWFSAKILNLCDLIHDVKQCIQHLFQFSLMWINVKKDRL